MIFRTWVARLRGLFLFLLCCQSYVALAIEPKIFENGQMVGWNQPLYVTDSQQQTRVFSIKKRIGDAGVKIYQSKDGKESVVDAGGTTDGVLSAFTVAMRSDGRFEIAGIGDGGKAFYLTREKHVGSGAFEMWSKVISNPPSDNQLWAKFSVLKMGNVLEYDVRNTSNTSGVYFSDPSVLNNYFVNPVKKAYERTLTEEDGSSSTYYCRNEYSDAVLNDKSNSGDCLKANGLTIYSKGEGAIWGTNETVTQTVVSIRADGRFEVARIYNTGLYFFRQRGLNEGFTQLNIPELIRPEFHAYAQSDTKPDTKVWKTISVTSYQGPSLNYEVVDSWGNTLGVYSDENGAFQSPFGPGVAAVINGGYPLRPGQTYYIFDSKKRLHRFRLSNYSPFLLYSFQTNISNKEWSTETRFGTGGYAHISIARTTSGELQIAINTYSEFEWQRDERKLYVKRRLRILTTDDLTNKKDLLDKYLSDSEWKIIYEDRVTGYRGKHTATLWGNEVVYQLYLVAEPIRPNRPPNRP